MALVARSSTSVAARAARPGALLRAKVVPGRRVPLLPAKAYKEGSVDTEDVNKKLQEALENTTTYLQTKWDETEDKPAAVAVTAGAVLLLITASSVVDAVDKIPVLNDIIELIGVGVTGWFVWRYLVFGPDREELVNNIKAFLKKVYGA